MRSWVLAALVVTGAAVAAGKAPEVEFNVRVQSGTRFALELLDADGGTVWRRRSDELFLDAGRGKALARGWKRKQLPVTARLALSLEGLEQVSCTRNLISIPVAEPRRVIAVGGADAGCQVAVYPTKEEYLRAYERDDTDDFVDWSPVGDFPPYAPPFIHGGKPAD